VSLSGDGADEIGHERPGAPGSGMRAARAVSRPCPARAGGGTGVARRMTAVGGRGDAVRSFVAIVLPDAIRAELAAAVARLRAQAPRLAWVPAENLHLTLRFLGGLDPVALAAAGEAVAAAAATAAPFQVVLGGLGGFPSARAPRVVWAGVVAGGEALAALHRSLERELAARGFPPEERPYHAHVTLGRARDPRGGRALADALGAAARFGALQVVALHLLRSELGREAARYSELLRAPLGGRPRAAGDAGLDGYSSSVDMPEGPP